jgi:large subunit ribosomal protein L9
MKVILLEDVDKQGEEGEIANVSKGYALNYLIPQNKAKKATKGAIQNLKKKKQRKEKRQKQEKNQAQQKYQKLKNKSISVARSANEDGGLYSSVNSAEVAQTIEDTFGVKLDSDQIILDEVKTTGDHQVQLNFLDGTSCELTLKVKQE